MKAHISPMIHKGSMALPAVIFLMAAPHLLAQEASNISWSGAADNNWNTSGNWTPVGPPVTGSNAHLGNGGTINVSPGAANPVAQLLVNGTSTLEIAAGLTITSPSNGHGLYVGASGSSGTISVTEGGALSLTGGNFGIGRGQSGSITLAEGGSITASGINEFHVGWDGGGSGTITQTGGTFTKSGGGDTRIGAFGGSGKYEISGGTSILENLRIAYAGSSTGTFTQSGGTVNHTGEIAVGWDSSGNATYNISAGTLTTSQRIRFGIGGSVRDNLFNQTGGTVTVTDGRVDIGENAGPKNTYDISDGTLNVNGDGRILVGAFGDSSGTLNVSGNAVLNLANGIILGDGGSAAGIVNISGGTINTNRIVSGGSTSTQYVNFNGGKVVAKSDEGNMIAGARLVATLNAGGVTIDSNGFDIGIGVPLGGTGGLTKTGENQLKLLGMNTYTGDTVVNQGTLTLIAGGGLSFTIGADGVNNSVSGVGALNLFGSIQFDLANAASQGMWNIIDVGSLASVTYGDSFSVSGWDETIPDSNIWTHTDGGTSFSFDGTTGVLTAIPEPSTSFLAFASIGLLFTFRRRGY